MTVQADVSRADAAPLLTKIHAAQPALVVTGPTAIAVRSGVTFAGRAFATDTAVALAEGALKAGADYAVTLEDGVPVARELTGIPAGGMTLGGFHFAPGGNATARAGGDSTPQINPCSLWDLNFRPACPDPRGMVLVEDARKPFWADVYLLGVDHLRDGTSKYGAVIADGDDRPHDPETGKPAKKLDYDTAVRIMAHHGKQLLGLEEFLAAAFGVTERSARDREPTRTALDAPRTSRCGLMQATGNMWVWGHDGDPDTPRASLFGGSWLTDGRAGSRYASLDCWPGDSGDSVGARGRSDHLQLA